MAAFTVELKLNMLLMAMPILSQLRKERSGQANREDGMDAAPVPIIMPAVALNQQHLLRPIASQHIQNKIKSSATTKKDKGQLTQ